MSINKNKKSLALDLKNEESQKIMHDLVKKSDIVIENLLEKSKKFKIDYDSLKKIKSDLI
jgi:succinate--hydroxymethylglutarate CoA-transferase